MSNLRRPITPLLAVALCLFLSALPVIAKSKPAHHAAKRSTAKRSTGKQHQSYSTNFAQTIGQVNLQALPAKKALQWWSKTTHIQLVVDWKELTAAGIDPSEPITLKLKHVPALLALHLIAEEMTGGATPHAALIEQRIADAIQILTKREADRESVIRIYPILDLIFQTHRTFYVPRFNLQTALRQSNANSGQGGYGGGSGSNSGLFGNTGQNQNNRRRRSTMVNREKRGKQLAEVIRKLVTPKAWRAHGGNIGVIIYHQGLLVIRAPRYIHRQIAQLLGPGEHLVNPITVLPKKSAHQARVPR